MYSADVQCTVIGLCFFDLDFGRAIFLLRTLSEQNQMSKRQLDFHKMPRLTLLATAVTSYFCSAVLFMVIVKFISCVIGLIRYEADHFFRIDGD